MLTQCSRSLFSASHLCSRESFVLKRQYGRDSTAYCISSRTSEIFKPRGPCVFYCFLFVIVLCHCQLSLISLPAFVCDNRSTTCAGPLRRAALLLQSAWAAFTRLSSPAPALVYSTHLCWHVRLRANWCVWWHGHSHTSPPLYQLHLSKRDVCRTCDACVRTLTWSDSGMTPRLNEGWVNCVSLLFLENLVRELLCRFGEFVLFWN